MGCGQFQAAPSLSPDSNLHVYTYSKQFANLYVQDDRYLMPDAYLR